MDRATVRVLFLGGGINNSFHLQRHLKESGCECSTTTCAEQCLALLDGRIFDLFISTHPVHLGSALIQRLSRLSCSAFYRLAVEDGFWWVPVLDSGTECLGLPALRPIEFIETIDRIVADLRLSKANGARKAHRAAASRRTRPRHGDFGARSLKLARGWVTRIDLRNWRRRVSTHYDQRR